MSIPLIQKPEKDDINTSIIAIKRNIERINMLLGLSNSEEIDTSKFATKDELQQAVTDLQPVNEVAVDNMHSVTSNAVAEALSYYTTEHKTGEYWIDGKPTYTIVILNPQLATYLLQNVSEIINCIIKRRIETSQDTSFVYYDGNAPTNSIFVSLSGGGVRLYNISGGWDTVIDWVYLKYTKTTD